MFDVTRNGNSYYTDNEDITSDCNQIVFINSGDTKVTVGIKDTLLKFPLEQNEHLLFGKLDPCFIERSRFEIVFDPVGGTTKDLKVMKVYAKTDNE